jgi:hypothetical protein
LRVVARYVLDNFFDSNHESSRSVCLIEDERVTTSITKR